MFNMPERKVVEQVSPADARRAAESLEVNLKQPSITLNVAANRNESQQTTLLGRSSNKESYQICEKLLGKVADKTGELKRSLHHDVTPRNIK